MSPRTAVRNPAEQRLSTSPTTGRASDLTDPLLRSQLQADGKGRLGGTEGKRTDRKAEGTLRTYDAVRAADEGVTYNAATDPSPDNAWFDPVEDFERPEIHHDHGFLEGWDDRNGNGLRDEDDWRATRTGELDEGILDRTTVTAGDVASFAKWQAMLNGAETLRPDLAEGTRSYRHFFEGGGAPLTIDYDAFLTGDSAGAVILASAIEDAEYAVLSAHDDAMLAGHEGVFSTRQQSDPVTVGAGRYPYPGTENWQKAIGGHSLWFEMDATVTPDPASGERTLHMTITFQMEDRYNFNPGQADEATGIKDEQNGRFATLGWGKQFLQTGTATRQVTSTHPLDRWLPEEDRTHAITTPTSQRTGRDAAASSDAPDTATFAP